MSQFLTVEAAKDLAYEIYEDRRDKMGFPEIDHVEAVVDAVSSKARAIAYMHDGPEDGLISFRRLYGLMSPIQFETLLVLTREPYPGMTYRQYIQAIKDAPYPIGPLAREIKVADLYHNMTRPGPSSMTGMKQPG